MFFRVKNRQRMVAESEDRRVGGMVGSVPTENHPAMAQVQAVEKPKSEMMDGFSGGGGEGIDNGHVRRMRDISGSEIR